MEILPIYGSIGIHSYGLCISCGITVVWYLLSKDTDCKRYLTFNQLHDFLFYMIISGVIGGRILYGITMGFDSWYDVVLPWTGGFSILGTVIAVIFSAMFFLYWYKIDFFPAADIFALYAPLLHSIARLGCYTTGCCGGIDGHQTQLYSVGLYAFLFLILLLYKRYAKNKVEGTIFSLYLIGGGIERFMVDFVRVDRLIINYGGYVLSANQWIALGIIGSGLVTLLLSKKNNYECIQYH